MKYCLLILVFLANCVSNSEAQVKVSGFVYSEDSLPISGADILIHKIRSENKPLVFFTRTNHKGFYALKIENTEEDYSITVKAATFRTIEIPLKIESQSTDIKQNYTLHSSVSYLDTVKVDIKVNVSRTGDTITFNPNAYLLKNEVHIEDMLKRLPGIEVKDDGKIYFNGKPVTNVLIDGDDLFRDQYKLLTQNAAPKIVDRVQIIKNYQKDQLLKEFNRAGDQVINLKIKDQYKNYLFGNATIGYGSKENMIGDLFLIKLGAQMKTQAGVNYNTTGTNYSSGTKFNQRDISRNDNPFFNYTPAEQLLSVPRFYYPQIPDYYQNRNNSIRTHFNTLFKKKQWETLINAGLSKDKSRENQELHRFYSDGTVLFNNDIGLRTDYRQEYSITGSKNSKDESIYINAALRNTRRVYTLNTTSNQALESQQRLTGDDTDWQLNFNYNKRIGKLTLWSTKLGYFNQRIGEQLTTDPDFLFWLFPEDFSKYNLFSNADIQLRYLTIKSSLLLRKGKFSHEFTGIYITEKRTLISALNAKIDTGEATFFGNDDQLNNPKFSVRYSGTYQVSAGNKVILNLSNDPQILKYNNPSTKIRKTLFFYDYSLGISKKARNTTMGFNVGIQKQPQNHNLFFANPVQSDFHRLVSGRIDTFGIQSSYLQANYSLFSLKLGWIAFLSANFSRNENKYIRSIETKEIAIINSHIYFPNSTNQLFFLFNSQKTLGKWPFSLNSNIVYNTQSDYNSFNGSIHTSSLRFLNTTIGAKSLLESILNFDYYFSWLHTRNILKLSETSASSSNTILNKVNVYLTPQRLFNTTITLNSMTTNKGSFHGNFLDIKCNKKFLKKKLIIEFNWRNIFDKKYISNTIINSYFTRESTVEIRGREFFFTFRYEFR